MDAVRPARLLDRSGVGTRQEAPERRAAIDVVLGPDRSAVCSYDRTADRKSEAEALIAKRHERLEHLLELALRNPNTVVRYRELHEAALH